EGGAAAAGGGGALAVGGGASFPAVLQGRGHERSLFRLVERFPVAPVVGALGARRQLAVLLDGLLHLLKFCLPMVTHNLGREGRAEGEPGAAGDGGQGEECQRRTTDQFALRRVANQRLGVVGGGPGRDPPLAAGSRVVPP